MFDDECAKLARGRRARARVFYVVLDDAEIVAAANKRECAVVGGRVCNFESVGREV